MHDWNGDCSSYEPMVPYLDEAAFTYVFADLRGYGKSRHLTGEYTVSEISADCLALADRLAWDQFHVIGHSMTGVAAQRIALDAPERVKSVIAVCPMSAAGSSAGDVALNFFASTTKDDNNFRRLIKYVSHNLSDRWVAAKLRQSRMTVNAACRAGYLAMFSKANFVEDVRGLMTPVLVIVGEMDPGLDAAAMKQTFLAWYPNAELQVISNCGHYPMQECPPFFASIIESFLSTHID
jgi:3-oxoadipate enol-lactonase